MMIFALISAISVCVTWAAELQQLKVVNGIQEIMRPVPIPGERWQEAQAALKQGHALILKGKYDEAEKILRPAVALSRGNADDIEQELSEISLRQGKYQVAYDLIDKVRPELGDGRRYSRIGFLKAALGDYQGSKAMWDDMGPVGYIKDAFVDDWPNVYDISGLKMAWLLVIGYLANVDDYLGAEFYFHLAEGCDIDSPILNYYLGNIAFLKEEYARSADLLKRAEFGFHVEVARRMAHDCWMRADFQKWLREKGGVAR